MGFEDEAEQSNGRPCRQMNGRSKRPSELTSSIVPRGTSFHHAVELEFPPIGFDLCSCHAAAAACSRVQRNSVPSTHIRCMITASPASAGALPSGTLPGETMAELAREYDCGEATIWRALQ